MVCKGGRNAKLVRERWSVREGEWQVREGEKAFKGRRNGK